MALAGPGHAHPPGAVRLGGKKPDANKAIAPRISALRGAFRRKKRLTAKLHWRAIAGTARLNWQPPISTWNLLGCHGILSVNEASAVAKPGRLFTT